MPAVMTPGGPADLMTAFFKNRIVFVGQAVNAAVAQRVISQLLSLAAIDDTQDIKMYINCPGGSTYSILAIYDCMAWVRAPLGTCYVMNVTLIAERAAGALTTSACVALLNTALECQSTIVALLLQGGSVMLLIVGSLRCSTTALRVLAARRSQIKPDVSTVCFGLAASQGALLLAGGAKGKRFAMPNARIMIHQPQGGCGGTVDDVRRQVNEVMSSRDKIDKMYAAFTGQPLERVQKFTERDRFFSSAEAQEFGLIDGIIETEY
eukprot:SM000082S22825  [mRNA]  locus=s82:154089:156326:- [translate_table: standard]